MVRIEAGMLARSKAGHDRNKLYIIIRSDAEYVWLADGVFRTIEKPKKKKKKHIQVVHRIPKPVQSALGSGETLLNEHIKTAIESENRDKREDHHV